MSPEAVLSGSEEFLNVDKVIGALNIQPGMHVADFGCGSGYKTIAIAQKVGEQGRVTALDVQEAPLDAVHGKAKAVGLANVDTVRADLEVLGSSGLPDSSQDMVLLANILFQSTKKKEILQEAKRVLKSGGILTVVDWKKNVKGFGPPNDLRTDEDTMRALVQEVGFTFQRAIDTGQFHFGLLFTK